MKKLSISIIGTGALGSELARAADGAGFPVYSLFNRTETIADELALSLDVKHSGAFPTQPDDLGEVVFLTVPDNRIRETASKIADIIRTEDIDFSGRCFIHCTGTLPSDVLSPLKESGASIASFHPLQTFTAASGPADFQDIYIDIEGEKPAVSFLKDFARALGSQTIEIEPPAKPYLHAAAVTASNYLVALMESAGQIAEMGGLNKDDALRALMPLVQKSVENIQESDTLSGALSGPVARGDTSTISGHLKLLEQNPRLAALYRQMGNILVELTEKSTKLSAEQSREMRTLFDSADG